MKVIEVKENLPKKIKKRTKRQEGILISQTSFTQLFNIQITKFKYSCIIVNILEMIHKSQKK